MKAVENFKWYVMNHAGELKSPECEWCGIDGVRRFLDNRYGFDTEREAVNALMAFCDNEFRSKEFILIKSYEISPES